jgi:hypothetical protein
MVATQVPSAKSLLSPGSVGPPSTKMEQSEEASLCCYLVALLFPLPKSLKLFLANSRLVFLTLGSGTSGVGSVEEALNV